MFKNVTTKFVETMWEIVVLSSAPIRATTIYSMGTVHKSVKAQQRERERERKLYNKVSDNPDPSFWNST